MNVKFWGHKIFAERPEQWGLRGYSYLWTEMAESLLNIETPSTEQLFKSLIESEFEKRVGFPITHHEDVFVERYAHGGMSSGYICISYWQNRALPLLCQRFEKHVQSNL